MRLRASPLVHAEQPSAAEQLSQQVREHEHKVLRVHDHAARQEPLSVCADEPAAELLFVLQQPRTVAPDQPQELHLVHRELLLSAGRDRVHL